MLPVLGDKAMKRWWRCIVRHKDEEDTIENEWVEEMCLDCDPQLVIDNFNATRDATELERVLIAAIPITKDEPKPIPGRSIAWSRRQEDTTATAVRSAGPLAGGMD